ncbi:DUF4352 domain-containing protein [Streptomyces antimicrobicus]|uniref:DUF4352 domain-containing protein n=1 Tax=Streptomyces antimicrobicus TaxID=2883108 RepID=A0ABS8BEF3_9ACTN|nr:DUF4352 domain-containing protein [Streptomyces antimicrobicus]MCB5182977.1 DUF4352 domain-containing protein [Streptomyces antimicrobicus]
MRRIWMPWAVLALLTPALLGAAGPSDETIPLRGNGPGERLDVTVTRTVDPAPPEGPADVPEEGERLVAVEFRLENTGTAPYRDSPQNGAYLIDSQGQRFASVLNATSAGAEFPGTVTLAPQDTALGLVTFAIPAEARIAALQFAMNSGFADDVGQWTYDAGS